MYLQSISSRIAWALDLWCFFLMYVMTQLTRWSLNVPLISWWSRSGVITSYMLAWGKCSVNGYRGLEVRWHRVVHEMKVWTKTFPTIPYSIQRTGSWNCLTNFLVKFQVLGTCCGSSSSCHQSAVHLYFPHPSGIHIKKGNASYFGHQFWTMHMRRTCSG